MTVAYILRHWPVCGGVETVTATLANAFIGHGHQIHILYSIRKENDPMPYQIDERIKEKRFDSFNYSKKKAVEIATYLEKHKVDILINQGVDFHLCYEAQKMSGVKLITCWHYCLIPEQKNLPFTFKQKIYHSILGKYFYQRWRERVHMKLHLLKIKTSDSYVLLSDSYKFELLRRFGDNSMENKLESIPNPLTYSFNFNMRQYKDKNKEILFVGRIEETTKRLSYILKIWKEIEKDIALEDWRLRIIGNGKDMDSTLALSKQLGLERVNFEGFKDPQPYYEQASIIMMTSAHEGFPMVLIEASQYAVVPIVMDSFSALSDIIINRENGIIVNDNDIRGFAESMKELMLNDDYREQLARNGLESCKKYEIGRIVDRWEKLFYSHLGLYNTNTK